MVDAISIIIAAISLVGTVVSATVAAWATFYRDDRKRMTEAEAVRAKYRDPLLLAAEDLQSKLINIVDQGIAHWIVRPGPLRDYLLQHTCFVVGQYLAWEHILRREVQFLRFSTDEQSKALAVALSSIHEVLHSALSRSHCLPCVLYRGEQAALGEIMTVEENGQHFCMGYAAFCAKWKEDAIFRGWFQRFADDIATVTQAGVQGDAHVSDKRLRRLQHLLVDLIEELDPKGMSYENNRTERCRPSPSCTCRTCKTTPILVDPSARRRAVEKAV